MPVVLNDAQRESLRRQRLAIRTFVDFHLDSGRYSFWDGPEGHVEFDGGTYYNASDFGEIGSISMGTDLGAEGLELKLNGTKLQQNIEGLDPATLFGTLEDETYQMRRVDIRFGFFDCDSGELIFLMRRFAGVIDQARQVEEIDAASGTAQSFLIIALESLARRYGVRVGRTRSNDDQQEIWPGDTFFKFTASSVAKGNSIPWGRAGPKAPTSGILQDVFARPPPVVV